MDRDKRWERIGLAKDAMVDGKGEKATDPVAAAKRSYEKGITDEFIEPVVIVSDRHKMPATSLSAASAKRTPASSSTIVPTADVK